MASIDNLVLRAFPRDGRYYRLDAVGTIRMVPDRITPMIEVQLTPLRPAFTRPTHDPRAFDMGNRVLATVSVGWYPILKMGSFWRNGRIQSVSSLESARFGIDTPLEHVRNRRAFESLSDAPLIPQDRYNLHPHMTETRYLIYPNVQHGAYRCLIIPCTEISRFYYTNSTPLALHIFSGALILTGNDRVLDDSRSGWLDEINGIYMVQLGMHIPDTDHLTVGRIAAGNSGAHTARYEARSLVSRAIYARNNNTEYQVFIRPPFRGRMALDVLGMPLSEDTFLALQIQRCSGPFPFAELFYGRDNDGRTANIDSEKPKRAWNRVIKHKSDPHFEQMFLDAYASRKIPIFSKRRRR